MDGQDMSFVPTVEWMREKYDEMNENLFNGQLGDCHFTLSTTSSIHTLGWFGLKANNVKCERLSRKIFIEDPWSLRRIYVDKKNFYSLTAPTIALNAKYHGTEHGFIATLVHEMCHYYTYMWGYAPKQGHGREFKEIGELVSSRSNGEFTIQRLATAEEMSEFELNDEEKAKIEDKQKRMTALFQYKMNGQIGLTTTSSNKLISLILNNVTDERKLMKVVYSNDPNLLTFLGSLGYRKNTRTWRYYFVHDKEWINTIKNYKTHEKINPSYQNKTQEEEVETPNDTPKQIFSIKTSNGVFECEFDGNVDKLKEKLKERFPTMKDEALDKIINNKSNYRLMESKDMLFNLISETVNEVLNNMDGNEESINISNLNLGKFSPFEVL